MRIGAGIGLASLVAVAAVASLPPAPGIAVPASEPAPVSADLFLPIGVAHEPSEPFTITFGQPMDRASVEAALSVEPQHPHQLAWDGSGRTLTVVPVGHWAPDTLYRVLVATTARSEDGGALAAPMRSVVLTGTGGSASIAPTMATTTAVRLDSSFRIRLDRAATPAAVRAAIRTDPPLAGDLHPENSPNTFRFEPFGRMDPDTTYRVWLEGLVDADGVPFEADEPLLIRTVDAPAVRSIRPRDGARAVDRTPSIRIRFTQSMDRARTASAARVTADGRAVRVRTSWSADGRTLLLRPAKALPYDARVVVRVSLAARSAAGADVAEAERATFTVKPKPQPAAVGIPTGGGGAASGSWAAVEQYYLRLMNCTRTGGWVTSAGACSSPGGRDVAPLRLNGTISAQVARPYARLLATRGACSHFIGGSPGDRLRAAGFGGNWAENIGCRDGNPYSSVLGTHLFYQREKPWNGGHYRNLMNPAFSQVGIGVWVASGRTRLVIDFWAG
ncbi:MAG TPA: Ig-like domain-containing protein [Candidatus Limnocylindrales bacterium]|nr:Ig-like domain-containing protein [Candidatus Limnocylindrales bacterium]